MPPTRLPSVAIAAIGVLSLASCSVSTDDAAPSGSGSTSAVTTPGEPARGVTDDTIKVGAAFIDVEGVRETYGVELGSLPDEILPALVEATNADGGINGRDVELAERLFDPVSTESSDRACRELVEDEQVFAIVGTFLGDSALCVTETYATTYIGGFGLTPERQERSAAPFITPGANEADTAAAAIELLVEDGRLDGAKVGLYWESSATTDDVIEGSVVGPLEDAGVDVVSAAPLPEVDDANAAGNEADRILQRFEADGADTLLAVSGLPVLLPALERTSWDPQIIINNGQILDAGGLEGFGLTDPSRLAGAIGAVEGYTTGEVGDSEVIDDCIEAINAHSDLAITRVDLHPVEQEPESRDYRTLAGTCALWDLTVAVLRAAGDQPTAASVLAGLSSVDASRYSANPDAALSEERWGIGQVVRIWEFDEEAVAFRPVDD